MLLYKAERYGVSMTFLPCFKTNRKMYDFMSEYRMRMWCDAFILLFNIRRLEYTNK